MMTREIVDKPSPHSNSHLFLPNRPQSSMSRYGANVGGGSSKSVYLITPDETENDRLDAQHYTLMVALGGKPYLGPVEDVLAASDHEPKKAILDLGTGSGIWCIDMARRFPHVDVVGVDTAPKMRPTPINCHIQVHDINSGLVPFYGSYNLVHTRLISSGIRDYQGMVSELTHVVQPGGMILLGEWDFRTYDANFQPKEAPPLGHPGYSYIAGFLWMLRQAGVARGGAVDAARHLHDWVKECEGFDQVGYRDTWIPVTAPAGSTDSERRHQRRVFEMMLEDIKFFVQASKPALLQAMPREAVDALEVGIQKEVDTSTVTAYVRLQNVWARRTL